MRALPSVGAASFMGLLVLACSAAHAQNLVVNGGFEQPVVSQPWAQRMPGETFGGWTVDNVHRGIVHVASFGQPLAFEGAQSVELNFFQSCGVSQAVPTTPGRRYAISFAMAGQLNAGPNVKHMRVDWAGAVLAEVAWDRSAAANQWQAHALITPPAGGASAVLRFYGLEEVDGGAYLDDVRVVNFCVADFNGDGSVDFFDYLDFVAAFDAEDPSADVNGDETVDFFDYLDFVAAFDQGCEG